ncbi:LOW QUALITY PROTEIN: MHC class II transactivator [Dasypus novemcinctus]|uniref:LOW QUALITY PROTEIN: MHC class II transactivator n=1 Tax=Dasypus novemcinctus TaxID=9361 RepID=UPI00265F6389|nr:LOW QUALITY PROTEIN: MHC class II transactivator [Dasypus novemcinctus]
MDHFQAILAQVRALLSSRQPSHVQALLDRLLREELVSREYHHALLHEPDAEALARQISLTLLQKGEPAPAGLAWAWSGLPAPETESIPSHGGCGDSGQCTAMDSGPLEGSYLELLNSNADPLQLYHFYDQMDLVGEEETELYSEPDTDTINCDQFSKLLREMEGDEETREAYANIAELDQYVFQDSQLEGLGKDIFKHIGSEDVAGESVEVLPDAGPRSQKRPFPEELPADPKKPRKLGPPSGSVVGCLNLPAAPIRIVPTLPTLPQGLWQISGAGAGISSILIYHGKMPPASQVPPSSGPAVHGLPRSPDRPGSTSPFAPSAADLPGMPEPALTSRADRAEDETSPTQSPEAHEVPSEVPKWPEGVERFRCWLRDKYLAEPAGPDGFLVEAELTWARLERSSSKGQERELATLDWAERRQAAGGLAEVLQAAGEWRRRRDTQVVAVLGKAGQGKSCWARAVSRAWACGQLPQYDFVLSLPGLGSERPGDTCRLQDLLFSLGPRPLPAEDELFNHVVRRPDRLLLILDAPEELEAPEGLLHGAGGPGPSGPHSPRGLLAGLLQRKLLRGCTLLLTARPRGRLTQNLAKADVLLEMAGFSAEQAETYVTRYFGRLAGGPGRGERAVTLLRGRPFLLSHSHSPALCRAVCQLCEALPEPGDAAELPSTLTGLYVGLLGPAARDGPPGALVGLAKLAWELGRRHKSVLQGDQLPSAEARAWALAAGLLRASPGGPGPELAFSSFVLQCFLGALWLALSGEVKDKELPQYLALTPRKKRPYDNWLEATPRFLTGLLLQPRARCLALLAGPAAAAPADRKQKVLARYLRRLQPGTLRAGRLLELLHCAHEAEDAALRLHVLHGLPARLCFRGTRLTPPDAHVLGCALEAAGRDFSLDLRGTGIDPPGLGSLVGLGCVTHFRAALSDTVGLWESLQQRGEATLLRAAEEKFVIEPFKAESVKDVADLAELVRIQRTRSSSGDAARELPAVRGLKKLEFALGPVHGPRAFPKLAAILPAFSSLQHLDLDSLSENKIGDAGVTQLSATFPQLKALETLNLSQNCVTDVGACQLAQALPALAGSLLRLSLYNNCICDAGAESLARVLPDMAALRVLDVQYNKFTAAGAQQLATSLKKCPHVETLAMWTPTIPFGVQEHLQQLDSRISLR